MAKTENGIDFQEVIAAVLCRRPRSLIDDASTWYESDAYYGVLKLIRAEL